MKNLNQKGFSQIIILLILLAGIGVSVWLVQYGRTVLKPKAYEEPFPIQQVSEDSQAIPPQDVECNYAPQGYYDLHAKVSTSHNFRIETSLTAVPNCSGIEEIINQTEVPFVGTIAHQRPGWVWTAGKGDIVSVFDNLENLCKSRNLTGSICDLCRQKIDCNKHNVFAIIENIKDLSCSKDSPETKKFEFTGYGRVEISPDSFNPPSCWIRVHDREVSLSISATSKGDEYVPSPEPTETPFPDGR